MRENSEIELWPWAILGGLAALYLAFVGTLLIVGRRSDARALAGFIPDCIVLLRRLLADDRVPRAHRAVLFALVAYLVMPIDLVPDFIPVIGQLDDVLIAALALRYALRGGDAIVREHWPGPDRSLRLVVMALSRPSPASGPRAG